MGTGVLGTLAGGGYGRKSVAFACWGVKKFWCSHDVTGVLARRGECAVLFCLGASLDGAGPTSIELVVGIELKSLILAQIERWRHALHMQVERQRGGNSGGERRTGE